jgi:cytochrome c oxidase subunit 2
MIRELHFNQAFEDYMKHAKRLLFSLMAAAGTLVSGSALAVNDMVGGPAVHQLNFQQPATSIAADVYELHIWMIVICIAIFIAVFGVMFYSILKHRKSLGYKAASFHESTTVEIAWTVVPFVIVVLMALPATKTVVAMKDTSNADITIKATGMQWKWGYDYLKGEGEGIAFLSALATPRDQIQNLAPKGDNYLLEVDHPLVVPVNKKIRIVTTANDVIHAWGVPAFGVKQDAIPGFVRDTWFKAEKIGTYRGNCYELCGKEHAFMPIVVEVKSEADYRAWAEQTKKEMLARADDPNKEWQLADLSARGEKVYAANCVACHQATGKGVPGAFPALDGSKVVLGKREDHIAILLNGKAGTAMASFKGLSDTELAAVITYARNAWGNKAEDGLIQPAAVKAAR